MLEIMGLFTSKQSIAIFIDILSRKGPVYYENVDSEWIDLSKMYEIHDLEWLKLRFKLICDDL